MASSGRRRGSWGRRARALLFVVGAVTALIAISCSNHTVDLSDWRQRVRL